MRFNTLFLAIGLLLSIESLQVTSAKAKEKLFEEDTDFWRKFEKGYVDSFDITTSAPTVSLTSSPTRHPTISPIAPSEAPADIHTIPPTGPPSMRRPPIPSSVPSFTKSLNPSSKPSFSAGPSHSSAPTLTPVPTVTARPNTSAKPSSSAAPSYSRAPTLTPFPTLTKSPTASAKPSFSTAPTHSSAPTLTPFPTLTTRPTASAKPSSSAAPTHSSAPTLTPFPTLTKSPTASAKPSFSASPSDSSAEPSSTTCAVSADITCENEDGDDCDFANPVGEQCIGGNAQELRFIYTANSFCIGNNTQDNFSCVDEITIDQTRSSSVYIRAFFGDAVFYEDIVNEGNVFPVPITDDVNSINIEIRDLDENFGAGTLLQTMTMSVLCRKEDSLILLDTFGGLQLVGYRNEREGLKTVYTDLTIRYVGTNIGNRDMFLTGGYKTTPMTGTQPLLPTTESILMDPGASEIFSELLTVNLAAIVGGMGLDFSLLVQGQDAATREECGDSDTFTIKII